MTAAAHNPISSAAPARVIVTTSWDDDAVSGLRIAELLGERGLSGTFYVPTGQLGESSKFSSHDLRTLSGNGFEIGAHTISHRILTDLDSAELIREVGECKLTLQHLLGTEIVTFCYPRGRFNAKVVQEVQRAGYLGARTTRMLCSGTTFLPMEMPTTIQAYPHARSNYVRNLVRLGGVSALMQSAPDLIFFSNWLDLGKKMLDRVLRDGGIWHLYGHPWEIEKLNLWASVKEMIDYVAQRAGVTYLTNAQLLQATKSERHVGETQTSPTREPSLVN
jgi:peptidoglycan/xylan/chitin deacetylase (PgdA/CDA1 family)